MADDFGFQPLPKNQSAQPADELGFQPAQQAQPPKLPDTAPIEQLVQKNISTQSPTTTTAMPQTDAQKLDSGLGFSASASLKSGAKELPADVREHLVNAYKEGSATNAGDYMQNALPAAANAIASSPEPSYKDVLTAAVGRGLKDSFNQAAHLGDVEFAQKQVKDAMDTYLTAPYRMGTPDLERILGKTIYGVTSSLPALGGAVGGGTAGTILGGGPESPTGWASGAVGTFLGVAGVHYATQLGPVYAEELKDNGGDATKAYEAAKIKTGIGAAGSGLSFALFKVNPFDNAIKNILTQAFVVQPTVGVGQQTATNIAEGKPLLQGTGSAAVEAGAGSLVPLVGDHILKIANNHLPGHEALKPIIGQIIGKDAKEVTPQDINETINNGFQNAAPKAQDFHDVAAVMDNMLPNGRNAKSTANAEDFQTGKPVTINAYHGTPRDFENFGKTELNKEDHHYFTSDADIAKGYASEPFMGEEQTSRPNVRNADIKMENPKVIDAGGKTWAQIGEKGTSSNYEAHLAQAEGHDGLIIKNVKDAVGDNDETKPSNVYVSFDSKKINTVSKNYLDTLHETYKETGVHPDQAFEDSRNNSSIAADLAAGKVPSAYEHLRELTPAEEAWEKEQQAPKEEEKDNLSKEGATKSINPLAKIFNPVGLGESAKDMATAIRQGRGPENRDVAVIQDQLQKYSKDIKALSDEDRLKLISYMENRTKGAENPLPQVQEAADAIRGVYAKYADKIQEAFPDTALREDYFTHQYKDEGAAKKFFSDWVTKQGSERNLKQRQYPTLEEAIAAGLEPKTTNPIETVITYVGNMANLLAADKTVKLAQEYGVADYFRKGQQPDGWVPLNSNFSEKGGKILYAPEDAARVYNNDTSEKVSGPAGDILDAVQKFNNFASKMVLGLSGYHFSATSMASLSSEVANGTLGTHIPLYGAAKEGGKYIEAYLGRAELPPELQKALDLAVKNNTVSIKQQDYWKAGPAADYIDVFKHGSLKEEIGHAKETIKNQPLIGSLRVLGGEVGRVMDTVAKPLFDVYIPRIKISANINELHKWLTNHPDATPEQMDRAAQEIGDSIDNRFGEMMRDNLFWHQITRQTLQTALLSYSWVAGAARMLGGVKDIGATIMTKGNRELTSNAKYLLGMAATYAVVNGVRTYLGTGQAPDDWKDFVYPRTGGVTPHGEPERELLPGHTGQFTNYLHDGLGELGNEISPGLKLVYHLTANQDWRGLPITDENNNWFSEQRWGDYASYVLNEEEPLGIKNLLQGEKKGSGISTVEQVLGARPAPQFIEEPEQYEKTMKKIHDKEYKKKVKSDKKLKAQYEE